MIRNLLLSGGHGPGHDFAASTAAVAEALAAVGVATTVVGEPAEAAAALRAGLTGDGPVWDLCTVNALRWRMDVERYAPWRDEWAVELSDDDAAAFEAFVAAGGGLLALHTAVICFDAQPRWRALLGAAWDWQRSSHPPLGPVAVEPTAAGLDHPVTAGVGPFTVTDELYGDLDTDDDLEPLLVGRAAGRTGPLLWARHHGEGRVVTDLLGHDAASARHPARRALLGRAACWAAPMGVV